MFPSVWSSTTSIELLNQSSESHVTVQRAQSNDCVHGTLTDMPLHENRGGRHGNNARGAKYTTCYMGICYMVSVPKVKWWCTYTDPHSKSLSLLYLLQVHDIVCFINWFVTHSYEAADLWCLSRVAYEIPVTVWC